MLIIVVFSKSSSDRLFTVSSLRLSVKNFYIKFVEIFIFFQKNGFSDSLKSKNNILHTIVISLLVYLTIIFFNVKNLLYKGIGLLF